MRRSITPEAAQGSRGRRIAARGRAGQSVLEFALILPIVLGLFLGMVELGLFLYREVTLTHLSREAAAFLSRGASFEATFDAMGNADGNLELDGPKGRIILTEIQRPGEGDPVIIRQEARGGLSRLSAFGSLLGNQPDALATVPNGMTLPPGMSLWGVEVFSQQEPLAGSLSIGGSNSLVLHGMAAF
ncbi:MAG: TadE family protein [Candidatus Eisenbacteria bacterium]